MNTIEVVIIDDSEIDIFLTKEQIKNSIENINVVSFTNFDKFLLSNLNPDIILIDIWMDKYNDSVANIRTLVKKYPLAYIITISSTIVHTDIIDALRAGCSTFVSKGYHQYEDLLLYINKYSKLITLKKSLLEITKDSIQP